MSFIHLWNETSGSCYVHNSTGTCMQKNCCPAGAYFLPDQPTTGGTLVLYILVLCWIFLGVSIGADVFMTSIEVITSKESKITRTVSGTQRTFHVRVWNATVANLTLMALGSSMPEIALSVLEILVGGFHAGELGPSTIVGSAAFNLMVISAVCVVAIPKGETRTLKQFPVFLTTAAYSVFAYVWLVVIVQLWTPEVITVEEGILTCVFLIILVIQAYGADKCCGGGGEGGGGGGGGEGEGRSQFVLGKALGRFGGLLSSGGQPASLKSLGVTDKSTTAELVERLKEQGVAEPMEGKSKAHYRREAMRGIGGNVTRAVHHGESGGRRTSSTKERPSASASGGGLGTPGGAQSQGGQDVEMGGCSSSSSGGGGGGSGGRMSGGSPDRKTHDISEATAKANAEAGGHGVIGWEFEHVRVCESAGVINLNVTRSLGAVGAVTVEWATKNQSAIAGKDYEKASGSLSFGEGESGPLSVCVAIIDDERFEKDQQFTVVLSEVKGGAIFDADTNGRSEEAICEVEILDDDERSAKLSAALAALRLDFDELDLAATDYKEQIVGCFTLDDRSPRGVVLFGLTLPWRLLFAVVPPPGLCGGIPCFVFALIGILGQVILISEFAGAMGCQMFFKPQITAITWVALGTSLPDTFASVQAARGDKYADNAIGNVTGSNSVNVFFGLGLPWLIAAIYWQMQGEHGGPEWDLRYSDLTTKYGYTNGFVVRSEGLAFSVIVFVVCASITICIILLRRFSGRQELGGNRTGALASAGLMVLLWMAYVFLSILDAYGYSFACKYA
jgi:Ca2+/Na+ antiporter